MPKSAKRKLKVILDTNALFVPLKFRIDIFEKLQCVLDSDFEPILLTPVLYELNRLAREGAPKIRKEASFALRLTAKCRILDAGEAGYSADDAIVEAAQKWNCPVFTNDKLLKKKLRDINTPVIYVRQKSHLEIEGRL